MESVVAFRPGAKIRLQVLVDSGRAAFYALTGLEKKGTINPEYDDNWEYDL